MVDEPEERKKWAEKEEPEGGRPARTIAVAEPAYGRPKEGGQGERQENEAGALRPPSEYDLRVPRKNRFQATEDAALNERAPQGNQKPP